jgi:hypothetical protein
LIGFDRANRLQWLTAVALLEGPLKGFYRQKKGKSGEKRLLVGTSVTNSVLDSVAGSRSAWSMTLKQPVQFSRGV